MREGSYGEHPPRLWVTALKGIGVVTEWEQRSTRQGLSHKQEGTAEELYWLTVDHGCSSFFPQPPNSAS